MKDEPCPTCHIPLGASLKALREERDRLILFINQQRPKELEFRKRENDLKERVAQVDNREARVRVREEMLAREEAALTDLMEEARRPERDFEQLKQKNEELRRGAEALVAENRKMTIESQLALDALRMKLVTERKKRKETEDQADVARNELSELAETHDTLIREHDSLQARYAREIRLLETARDEVTSLKKDKLELSRKVKILSAEIAENDKKAKSLSKANLKLKTQNQNLNEQVSNLQPASFSITDIDILHALSQEVGQMFIPPSEIVSLGSGPIDENDFDRYLETLRISPCSDGCPWIIVGREGWTEEKLNELLDDADLDEVRVFSQELFIAGILTTHDPFSLPTEILMKFAEGHPALEYLIEAGFEWPEIILEEDFGEPVYLKGSWERVEASPLYRMGYQVGITHGQPRSTRRSILKNACQLEIPFVEDADYMEEWGRPRQSKRLWRIAHHIAWLIRSRKSIPSMCYAVKDWQDDLDWMEEQFYTNRMRFQWPHG